MDGIKRSSYLIFTEFLAVKLNKMMQNQIWTLGTSLHQVVSPKETTGYKIIATF